MASFVLERESSILRAWWLWAGIGAVVVAGAVTAGVLLTDHCGCVMTEATDCKMACP